LLIKSQIPLSANVDVFTVVNEIMWDRLAYTKARWA